MKSLFTAVCFWQLSLAKDTQVMLLMDASQGGILRSELPDLLAGAIGKIIDDDSSYSFAVSSFIDKPAPYSGVGTYGGYPNVFKEDYCYKNEVEFSSKKLTLANAIANIGEGSGLDPWEAQFEAMLRGALDPVVGWKADSNKIMLIVTDSFGHSLGADTLESHVTPFNKPVRCAGTKTIGGYGAMETGWDTSGWNPDPTVYKRYTELLHKRSCVSDLTESEQAEFDSIREANPVRIYPKVKEFDLAILTNDPETHCRHHEYPFYSDITAVFNGSDMKIFVLFHDPKQVNSVASFSDEEIWMWALSDDWALASTPSVWEQIIDPGKLTAADLANTLRTGFEKLTQ